MLAFVQRHQPIAQAEQLVQIGADEQNGAALVALLHDALVNELDRADVHASGGLADDQHTGNPKLNSRAMTTFCMLPPDSEDTGVVHAGHANIELFAPASAAYCFTRCRRQVQAAR